MHPRPVCCQAASSTCHPSSPSCQLTVYKLAQACILALYVATYSLQVGQTCILTVCVANLQPCKFAQTCARPVCCQPAAYKFDLPSFLTLLPTYSLQGGPSMHPRPVCCQPTAYKFVQTCNTVEVAILQPQLLAIVPTCNALQYLPKLAMRCNGPTFPAA